MSKRAEPDHPVHDLIAERWSPYGFDSRPVAEDDLRSLFEAARWAASSYNEQPWRFIVARQENRDEFDRLLSCLVEGNQAWAQAAPVLALGCVTTAFVRNDKPNAAAEHDLGLAAANLTFEATVRGLHVHQMIGIEPDKAREVYQIPEGAKALTALVVGYAADAASLADTLKQRDESPRQRKPLGEIVFGTNWGTASDWLD